MNKLPGNFRMLKAFWEDFIDAPYERQWALVTEMLAEEPELFDGEMVLVTI